MARAGIVSMLGFALLSACAPAGGSPTATPATSGTAGVTTPGVCPAAHASPQPPAPAEATRSDLVQATIAFGDASAPLFAVSGFGSMWVTAYRGEFVARIDPATNSIIARIPLPAIGGQPVGSGRLVVGPHGVWVPTSESTATGPATLPNQLVRIDPASNHVSLAVSIDSLYGVVDGPDGVWGGIDPRAGKATRAAAVQLDAQTLRVTRTVDLGPATASPQYKPEIDDALGSLWVVVADDRIARVDPSHGTVSAIIRTPGVPSGASTIAFAGGNAFVAEADSTVARINAATNCVDGVAHLATVLEHQGGEAMSVFPAPEGVYAAFDRGALARIDLRTLAVLASVRLVQQDIIGSPAYALGSVWYPTFGDNTVLRLRPLG